MQIKFKVSLNQNLIVNKYTTLNFIEIMKLIDVKPLLNIRKHSTAFFS